MVGHGETQVVGHTRAEAGSTAGTSMVSARVPHGRLRRRSPTPRTVGYGRKQNATDHCGGSRYQLEADEHLMPTATRRSEPRGLRWCRLDAQPASVESAHSSRLTTVVLRGKESKVLRY